MLIQNRARECETTDCEGPTYEETECYKDCCMYIKLYFSYAALLMYYFATRKILIILPTNKSEQNDKIDEKKYNYLYIHTQFLNPHLHNYLEVGRLSVWQHRI